MDNLKLQNSICSAISVPSETQLNATIEQCEENRNFWSINIKCKDVKKQYIGLKLAISGKVQDKWIPDSADNSTLPSLFHFQYTNDEKYVVFERKVSNISKPTLKDNLEVILECIGNYQARLISRQKEPVEKADSELKELLENVLSLNLFEDIDKERVESAIKYLEGDVSPFLEPELLVGSLGCPLNQSMLKVQNANFDSSIPEYVPLVYDALMYIFVLTDEVFRREHFKDLMEVYFNSLSNSLKILGTDALSKITRQYKETTLRFLLPIVKFRLLIEFKLPEDVRVNILRFLKYPLLNQEDVYEIIANNTKSKDYELISYSMKSLDERNGHLGEYYHLNVSINRFGEEEHFHFFAKVIIPPAEQLNNLVKSGLAQKEDFFYGTLLPLYQEYGLEKLADFSPKCYLSKSNWLLVLTDLLKDEFVAYKPNANLDYPDVKAVMSEYAKFIAATLILEEKLSIKEGKPVRMDELYPGMFVEMIMVYIDNESVKKSIQQSKSALHYIIELCPHITETSGLTQEEIFAGTDKIFMSLYKKISNHPESFRCTLTHGDMYIGNALLNHNNERNTPRAVLVDFQLMRYMPPVYDLLFFTFLCMPRNTRLQYLPQLIDEFYQDIAKYIQDFGYDVEKIFPRDSFDESIKYYRSAALSAALSYAFMIKINPKTRESIFQDKEKMEYYFGVNKRAFVDLGWEDDIYKETMTGFVSDIIDLIKKEDL
ncbi:uncharacterized protein LOC115891607 [Sitophilus oryzae]|uniref:Uncharacterized protein LOC115891607 n=1 Tax=Sitophilus oryzae TaxID=7048 RepID=A0A6J2YV42_SITOR|nr:uncharacterized protein LOC115891607 [Sitophilus oryzae]